MIEAKKEVHRIERQRQHFRGLSLYLIGSRQQVRPGIRKAAVIIGNRGDRRRTDRDMEDEEVLAFAKRRRIDRDANAAKRSRLL